MVIALMLAAAMNISVYWFSGRIVLPTVTGALSHLASMAIWGTFLGGASHSEDEEDGHPAGGLLAVLLAPVAATLIQMAISRAREFGTHPPTEEPVARLEAMILRSVPVLAQSNG